ncbi:unnamed protein product, partial [marine sediment metagenome]
EGLEEFNLIGIGLEPTQVTYNGSEIVYSVIDEDISLNLSSYDMNGPVSVNVYFAENNLDIFMAIAFNLLLLFILITLLKYFEWNIL